MKLLHLLVKYLPHSLKMQAKYYAEFRYWHKWWKNENHQLDNSFYKQLMLDVAGYKDESPLAGQIVADFGCGPRGSLCWLTGAKQKIGIDILADRYKKLGIDKHEMQYVKSTEQSIPLPDNSVDTIFCLNSLDHCLSFARMCAECLRILKPGGNFVASINLDEPATPSEPLTITMPLIQEHLTSKLQVQRMVVAKKLEHGHYYDNCRKNIRVELTDNGPKICWLRGQKIS